MLLMGVRLSDRRGGSDTAAAAVPRTSSAVAGSRVVVFGATGNVGRGAARAFLAAGAGSVIIVGRDAARLTELRDGYLGGDDRVHVVEADATTWEGAQEAAAHVDRLWEGEAPHHVVASSGPWWRTRLLSDVDVDTYAKATRSNVDAHFFMWKAFGPALKRAAADGGPRRTYLFINGASARHLPASGLTGFCALATHGLAALAMGEAGLHGAGLATFEIMLSARVADDEDGAVKSADFGDALVSVAVGASPFMPNTEVPMSAEDIPRMQAELREGTRAKL